MFIKAPSKKWVKKMAILEEECDCNCINPQFLKQFAKKNKFKRFIKMKKVKLIKWKIVKIKTKRKM